MSAAINAMDGKPASVFSRSSEDSVMACKDVPRGITSSSANRLWSISGAYLGTLEVTQDLSRLRELQGERRLLEFSAGAA